MKKTNFIPNCLVGSLVFFGSALACSADQGPATSIRHFKIQSESGEEARILELVDLDSRGMSGRLLVRTPQGRKLIFSQLVEPKKGRDTFTLLDDASGWHLSYVIDFGFTADTLAGFMDRAIATKEEDPVAVEIHLGDELLHAGKYSGGEPGLTALLEALSNKDLLSRIGASTGNTLGDSASFLASVVDDQPYDGIDEPLSYIWRPLTAILQAAVKGGAHQPSNTWEKVNEQRRSGAVLEDPDLLEFVSGFTRVENTDPLAGVRVHEVLGDGKE